MTSEDDGMMRVVLRDHAQPLLWERVVALPSAYAQSLIDDGRARPEHPRPIGFVWAANTEPAPSGAQAGYFPHRRKPGA